MKSSPDEPSYEYMLTVQERAPDSHGGPNHAYPVIDTEFVFSTAAEAERYARRSLRFLGDGTIWAVVVVPKSFRAGSLPGEMNALEALSNIEMLGTGYKRSLPDVVAIQSVVDMCRRVFHAFRMTREQALKELLNGVVERADYKRLNKMAAMLNVLPQALGDDPFELDEKIEKPAAAKPFAGYGPTPDDAGERGGGNDRPIIGGRDG